MAVAAGSRAGPGGDRHGVDCPLEGREIAVEGDSDLPLPSSDRVDGHAVFAGVDPGAVVASQLGIHLTDQAADHRR